MFQIKLKYKVILMCIFSRALFFAQPSNVLFIGNSFTHMHSMCKIYENLANSMGKQVFGDTIAVDGSTLKGHIMRFNTYQKIKSKIWDYAFIQGFSRELSYDSTRVTRETIPYAQMLVDSLRKYNPCITIFYFLTWGYADGNPEIGVIDSYSKMQSRILRGYKQMSKATGGIPIAPVGMVWQEYKKQYPNDNLYESDKIHPNAIGSYIAVNTFYNIIYNESSEGGFFPKQISLEDSKKIQRIANQYVSVNVNEFKYPNTQFELNEIKPEVDFDLTSNSLILSCKNKSKEGTEFSWDFGDGSHSSDINPNHNYLNPGTYNITLHVKKQCEWYFQKKTHTIIK